MLLSLELPMVHGMCGIPNWSMGTLPGASSPLHAVSSNWLGIAVHGYSSHVSLRTCVFLNVFTFQSYILATPAAEMFLSLRVEAAMDGLSTAGHLLSILVLVPRTVLSDCVSHSSL